MSLDKNTLDDFQSITGFDVSQYYSDFTSFMQSDYNYLVDYFSGTTTTIQASSFKSLQDLLKRKDNLFSLFTHAKNRLNNLKYWDLLSQIEDIDSTLMTVNSISKWLRSPKTNTSYSSSIEVNIGLRQGNTLEKFNQNVLKSENYQNDWIKTKLRNNLREEDYDLDGGNLLAVTFSTSGQLFINSVVDNINGDNILGIDIAQKLQFVNDDLLALSYIDTYKQSILILSSLQVGDDPYDASKGIDKNAAGNNVATLSIPVILRQMSANFSTDDTIKSFLVTSISRQSDGIYIIFVVTSVLGEISEFKHNLSN
jgi:hypothetical protein